MKSNGIEQQQVNGRTTFDVLARHSNGCSNGSRRINTDKSHIARKIEQSIEYMLQHLNEPLHVSTLASAVNVSPSHYSALFKRWTGCPPIDYFIHLRMQHACRLFDSTSWNVKEVAAALGYDDPFYFSRTFKAVNRVAPSEYRALPEKMKNSIKNAALSLVSSQPDGDLAIPEEGEIRRGGGTEYANGKSASRVAAPDLVFGVVREEELK